MRKILFLDHTGKISGGERSLLLILEKLDRKRFIPFLVTLEDGPLLGAARAIGVQSESMPISRMVAHRKRSKTGMIFLLFSSLMLLPGIIAIAGFARRKQVDIIYTNSQKAHLVGMGAGFLASVPVYWHFRDVLHEQLLQRLMRYTGLLFARHIIAISHEVASQFSTCGRVRKKVSVVYNALDIDGFARSGREGSLDLRKEFGLGKGTRIIASVGQIAEWKGQEYLLRAAKELVSLPGKRHFFIIGTPLFKEHAYFTRLKELVNEFGLDGQVTFTGFREDIFSIMSAIDVLVHTPVKPEPFGRVLIEAMVCNTPVVAFDIGAVREIVREGEGILVRPYDTRDLVRSIRSLLEDDKLREEIVGNAQSAARNRFDFPPLIERIEHLLDA